MSVLRSLPRAKTNAKSSGGAMILNGMPSPVRGAARGSVAEKAATAKPQMTVILHIPPVAYLPHVPVHVAQPPGMRRHLLVCPDLRGVTLALPLDRGATGSRAIAVGLIAIEMVAEV